MKKVILIALSLILALGMVSSFAFFGVVDWEKCAVGGSVNDVNNVSTTNEIRNDFTPSRGLPNATQTAIWYDEDASADGIYAKATSTTFIGSDAIVGDDSYFTVDLKATKLGKFCGVVFDEDMINGGNAAALTEFNSDEILEGYGFTLVDANTIKVFVNDATTAYVTYTLPFDASADWHTYAIYKEGGSDITIAVDNFKLCTIDFTKGEIKNADGTVVCNGFTDITDGSKNVLFAIEGDDIDVDFDNIGLCDLDEVALDGDSEATFKESSNPVEPSEATEAPADATEAPAEATEAPAEATEAPAEATDAPAKATEAPAPAEKKGCGSVIGAGAVLVLAACAIVCRKKD